MAVGEDNSVLRCFYLPCRYINACISFFSSIETLAMSSCFSTNCAIHSSLPYKSISAILLLPLKACGCFCFIFLSLLLYGIFMKQPKVRHFKVRVEYHVIWRRVYQRRVSRAGTSNYIPQIMWDVITCPCSWYLLLAHQSSYLWTNRVSIKGWRLS